MLRILPVLWAFKALSAVVNFAHYIRGFLHLVLKQNRIIDCYGTDLIFNGHKQLVVDQTNSLEHVKGTRSAGLSEEYRAQVSEIS